MMQGQGAANECPSCGIAVTAGYLRCPKCQTEIPGAQAHDAGADRVQGGTSVASSDGNVMWVVGALVAVAVAVILIFALRGGGGDEAAREGQPPVASPARDPASQPAASPNVVSTPDPADVQQLEVPPIQAQAAAVGALQTELEKARLWSSVEPDGEGALAVRSAYCADDQMQPVIQQLAGRLHSAGIKRLTCYERHGPVVFERELAAAP